MQLPEWTQPALLGVGAGAIALAILGFTYGGWVTGGSASEMSTKEASAAVAMALTPYCVQNSQNDPKSTALLEELKSAASYKRRGMVEEAGWATPLGATKPDRALAEACLAAITKGA